MTGEVYAQLKAEQNERGPKNRVRVRSLNNEQYIRRVTEGRVRERRKQRRNVFPCDGIAAGRRKENARVRPKSRALSAAQPHTADLIGSNGPTASRPKVWTAKTWSGAPSLPVSIHEESRLVSVCKEGSLGAEKFRFLAVRLRQLRQSRL